MLIVTESEKKHFLLGNEHDSSISQTEGPNPELNKNSAYIDM